MSKEFKDQMDQHHQATGSRQTGKPYANPTWQRSHYSLENTAANRVVVPSSNVEQLQDFVVETKETIRQIEKTLRANYPQALKVFYSKQILLNLSRELKYLANGKVDNVDYKGVR
jgi:hypothetical protein|tara:strand:+ start:1157 stop:1501 length:345 start_codon:yes stop_codon:yes gene_type:complete